MKYYFNTFENNIKLFGYMFSNLQFRRRSKTDPVITHDVKVPISYMGKERMYYLINNTQVDLNSPKIDAVYPKMGYSLTDMFPDWERMTNAYQTISEEYGQLGEVEVELNKIPYTFKFDLSIAVVHQSDLYQILEQIFTTFRPSYTLKANLNPLLGETKSDVTILLNNAVFRDFNEEAPFSENPEKPIVYSLEFTQKSWLWTPNEDDGSGGPGGFEKQIREIEAGIFVQKEPLTEEQIKSDSSYTIHIPEHIESSNNTVITEEGIDDRI